MGVGKVVGHPAKFPREESEGSRDRPVFHLGEYCNCFFPLHAINTSENFGMIDCFVLE